MENIVIIGSGGHSKVVIDIIEKRKQYKIIGLVDSFRQVGEETFNYPILGGIDELQSIMKKYAVHNCFIAVGDNWNRFLIYKKLEEKSLEFNYPYLIDTSAVIGKNCKIGKGVVVMPLVSLNANSVINDFCILNTRSSIDHDSEMGDYSSVGPGVTAGGNVRIGNYTHIGIGTTIKNNICIGSNSVIGAGSLIIKDQPSSFVCYGHPCIPVKARKSEDSYL